MLQADRNEMSGELTMLIRKKYLSKPYQLKNIEAFELKEPIHSESQTQSEIQRSKIQTLVVPHARRDFHFQSEEHEVTTRSSNFNLLKIPN